MITPLLICRMRISFTLMNKTRKCLYCEKEYNRRSKGTIYCSKKCSQKQNTKRNQEEYKVNLKNGHRHEVAHGIDDFAMTTHSVPHHVLQEAKNYYDHTNSLHFDGEKIVEDVEEILRITYIILAETLTENSRVITNRRTLRKHHLLNNDKYAGTFDARAMRINSYPKARSS